MRMRPAVAAALCVWLVARASMAQTASAPPGTIRGAVTDSSGSAVAGAIVRLQASGATTERTTITDQSGSFHFSGVEPGTHAVAITALGFADRKVDVAVVSGENPPLPAVVLEVAPVISSVSVSLTPHELATEQVQAEEKQRVLGIFPNFFVTYEPNAAPLTAAQKFQLGWKTILDPEVYLSSGLAAGIQQARNSYHEFGQGMEGYGKRFGASYADRASEVFIGHIVTQSIFHQDPRYFYRGSGGFRRRALYAIATAFVAKGDNGRWQPNYSGVVGGLAAAEISTLYYPASSRIGLRLFHSVLLGFGDRAASHLAQEFVYRKFTTHVPKAASGSQAVLHEGAPVSLISIDDLRTDTPQSARPVTFVLAKNLEVDGVVVAPAGSRATGQATYGAAGAEVMRLSLENVRLRIGERQVPLRSTEQKRAPGALDYHWVEDTGRIALVLYLDADVMLPPAR
jgi:hypothetical protein